RSSSGRIFDVTSVPSANGHVTAAAVQPPSAASRPDGDGSARGGGPGAPEPGRRRSWPALGIAAALIVLLGGGLGVWAANRGSPPAVTPVSSLTRPKAADCSSVVSVPYGTPLRTSILDGLRAHAGYTGLYYVKAMRKLSDWAYVEAAPVSTGV